MTEPQSWKGEREPQGQAVFVYPGDGAHNSETKGQTLLPWEMVFEAAYRPAGARMEQPWRLSCQVIFVILAGNRSEAAPPDGVSLGDTLVQDQMGLKHTERSTPPSGLGADAHPAAPAASQTSTRFLGLESRAHTAPPPSQKVGVISSKLHLPLAHLRNEQTHTSSRLGHV